METYFDGFHENEHSSTNLFIHNVDEMNDQLGILESIKAEENIVNQSKGVKNQYLTGKEDFHQIMSDWQQHVGLLQSFDCEDLGFGLELGLDSSIDTLNSYATSDLFEEKQSSILSKASVQKNQGQASKFLRAVDPQKVENLNTCNQKLSELIKTEPNLIGKVTILNGEKELLGKNIVGLHCLNEIKENPDDNCRITSTVINGKRYKIIIKPKTLKVKKLSDEKIRKTFIRKLLQANLVKKVEPKEDEIISEMRNGNYDVPILDSDILPNWDLVNLDWNTQLETESNNVTNEPEVESIKKIQPVRLKVSKLKKYKKKRSVNKTDEEVDVITISNKGIEGNTLGSLLKNFENEVAKLQNEPINDLKAEKDKKEEKVSKCESIKSSLPKEMIKRIEALKQKKDCNRIPIIQAMPSKKAGKCCTRMQDAVATMNRNKLLQIVSGGDTISLDHDYCTSFVKKVSVTKQTNKPSKKNGLLVEKNPKKDSGMESGDVSDTSEGPNTPEVVQISQVTNSEKLSIIHQNKKENEGIDNSNHLPTESSYLIGPQINVNTSSDSVKTKTVSNGNKALTNNIVKGNCISDSSLTENSDNKVKSVSNNENNDKKLVAEESNTDSNNQTERPKRKLKLEEYLSRRNIKEKQNSLITKNESCNSEKNCSAASGNIIESVEDIESKSKPKENIHNNSQNESREKTSEASLSKEKISTNGRRERSISSSSSLGDRRNYRRQSRSRSKSRSRWRSSGNCNSSKRREEHGSHRSRWSTSCEKRDFRSSSLSRSPSRESSTSSDCSSYKRRKNSNRYRRSRSRSLTRGRSRSRNRMYSNRHHVGNYFNHRSRSPFYAYSMREKQRQIEERRVIYVGRIEEGMTNAKLRKRFSAFGPIIDISLHFREYGDNYGFVTYAYKADAYDAVEHGNDDPTLPHYDLCFGGRRGFCREKYADLDGMPTSYSGFNDTPSFRGANDSFDLLLREAQAKLKNRKTSSIF